MKNKKLPVKCPRCGEVHAVTRTTYNYGMPPDDGVAIEFSLLKCRNCGVIG